MKVTYDPKVDAMYIYLNPKKKGITRTEEMDSGWIADYEGKELIGIEILDASRVLGSKLKIKEKNSFQPSIAHRIK
mgnify:CR=1 FL=1